MVEFYELAKILDLDMDKQTINTIYNLLDCGVNPDALSAIIRDLKQSQ